MIMTDLRHYYDKKLGEKTFALMQKKFNFTS